MCENCERAWEAYKKARDDEAWEAYGKALARCKEAKS